MEYSPTQKKFASAAERADFGTTVAKALGMEGTGAVQLIRMAMNATLRHPEWAQAIIANYVAVSLAQGRENFDAVADDFVEHCPVEVLDVVR